VGGASGRWVRVRVGGASDRLAMTKYMTEPLVATGRYFSRAALIISSVASASSRRILMASDVTCTHTHTTKTASFPLLSPAPLHPGGRVERPGVFETTIAKGRLTTHSQARERLVEG